MNIQQYIENKSLLVVNELTIQQQIAFLDSLFNKDGYQVVQIDENGIATCNTLICNALFDLSFLKISSNIQETELTMDNYQKIKRTGILYDEKIREDYYDLNEAFWGRINDLKEKHNSIQFQLVKQINRIGDKVIELANKLENTLGDKKQMDKMLKVIKDFKPESLSFLNEVIKLNNGTGGTQE